MESIQLSSSKIAVGFEPLRWSNRTIQFSGAIICCPQAPWLLIWRFGAFSVNFVFYVALGVDLSFFVVLVDLCVIFLDHFDFFCES